MSSTFRTHRMDIGVASAFILFSLQSCQLIPYHLLDKGDVPAVRVFDEKLRGKVYPGLTVLSPQDNQGKNYLALCVGIQSNRDKLCYRYEPQPPAVRLLSSVERQLLQKSLTPEQLHKARPCAVREFWDDKGVSPLFRFVNKLNDDTLWFGEKQVMPLGGKDIISVEVSPDGQQATIFSADTVIRDPNFMPFYIPFFSSSPKRDARTPKFRHYHQFFSLTEGTLSEPLRLPLAINGYPMHSCWSPDSKYVVYYGGRDYGDKLSPREGGKYPDYVAIVPLEEP